MPQTRFAVHCPLCNHAMETRHHGEVELDQCTGCGAVWFDAGELAETFGIERKVEASVQLAPTADGGADLPCPRCVKRLREVRVTTGKGLHYGGVSEVVYVCRGCKGAVLSRKALKRAHSEGVKGGEIPSDNPNRPTLRMEKAIEIIVDILTHTPWGF